MNNLEFPSQLRLHQPKRHLKLTQAFYEQHHLNRDIHDARDRSKKVQFFRNFLSNHNLPGDSTGVDLGCRGGALTTELKKHLDWVAWNPVESSENWNIKVTP